MKNITVAQANKVIDQIHDHYSTYILETGAGTPTLHQPGDWDDQFYAITWDFDGTYGADGWAIEFQADVPGLFTEAYCSTVALIIPD